MVRVEVTYNLKKDLLKIFGKNEAIKILELFNTLKENPHKGKELTHVGNIIVKELKYGTYRFYFITDGFKLKFLKNEEIKDIVLKFVRMSKKNNQQDIIDEIKTLLKKIGYEKI